jgi:Zn-dependent membrane protease YugP
MIILFAVLGAIAIIYGPHLWAKHILDKYNQKEYFSGNGVELARLLLSKVEISDVMVEMNTIGDHYNSERKIISLSEKNCGPRTLTAVVVAGHEVGHAIQDHLNYRPLKTRNRMIRRAVTLERLGAGLILGVPILTAIVRVPAAGFLMLAGGFTTLCIPVLIHFLTLPTEFDASFNRALPLLSTGEYIPKEDILIARKILLACALTYVANALVGLLNVWRWLRVLRR